MRKTVYKHIKRTHKWRQMGHSQLTDLYLSVGIRTTAVSLVGVFIPIYLHQLGYSIADVVVYYTVFAFFRVLINLVTAQYIGWVGPKHAIIASNILAICHMAMLFSLPSIGWPIAVIAMLHTTANSLFFTSYHTDFSKIKTNKDGGKEIGHMMVISKIGRVIGPAVGGLLAGFSDIRVSIAVAAGLLMSSLIPLFFTKEPVKTHQKISYKGLLPKVAAGWRDHTAQFAENIGVVLVGGFWSFYIALAIFSEAPYESIGLISTGATFVSIFTAHLFGVWSDKGGGKTMVRLSGILSAVFAVFRVFISSPVGAISHNAVKEATNPSATIPIVKEFYADADTYPGQRIAYITVIECISAFLRGLVLLPVLILMAYFDQLEVLRLSTVAFGFISCLVVLRRFK